jgi:eukaryotic-like serine/threonine-protein kinase
MTSAQLRDVAPRTRASARALSGRSVEARYHIGRPLGHGAWGVVYAARSLAPAFRNHGKRNVAMKVLGDAHVGDADAIARFTHEAFLASRFAHPNLVRVLDFGWVEPGRPYFVMERATGTTLDRVLAEVGRLPPAVALDVIAGAASGLKVLHESGVVHRDVKPSNLFYARRAGCRPRIRLIDLGVAGVFDASRARKLGTVSDIAQGTYGTPAYIAPEQAVGRRVDARADVYALACVAYRALTGVEPFRGSTVTKTVHAHLFNEAAPATSVNPALPASVDAVLARGLEKDPAERTACPLRFAAELALALKA